MRFFGLTLASQLDLLASAFRPLAYSGKRDIVTEANVMELLATAKVLAIDDLADVCENFVRTRIDKDNASDALEFAAFHGVDRLAAAARAFIAS